MAHHFSTTATTLILLGVMAGFVMKMPDPDAARLFGIPVARRTLTVFVANGALAGLAGVLASVLPARRASRVDVLRALQVE